MGVHSGKFAVVGGISTMRGWSVNEVTSPRPYVASNTLGGTGRRRGNKDWTGTVGMYGGKPVYMPGDTFTFEGYTAPANDIDGGTGAVYTGTAIVDQLVINWNWATADPISHSMNFGAASGALSCSSTTALVDSTFPDCPDIIDLVPLCSVLGGGSGYEIISCVTDIALTINAANKPFVNSCTGGNTHRKMGPIDWSMAINVQDDNKVSLPFDIGDMVAFQLPVPIDGDPSAHWLLEWGQILGFSNLSVNRETGDIIGMTINVGMAGFDHENEEVGQIVLPGEENPWWPAAT